MPRYAAIDIGSNSVRMLAAEAWPGKPVQTLAEDRQVTRLGASVFRSGRISPEAMTLLCEQLEKMAETYRKLSVVGIRAVATSAVRDAENQDELLDRASGIVGARVEIISGQEEARLIHLGVQSRWPHASGRVLLVDVGGGSVEVTLSENARLEVAFSKPLGAVRLTENFLRTDPPSDQEMRRLEQYIEEKLAAPVERIGVGNFDRVIATSATAAAIVCAVNRVPRARRFDADRLKATTSQIRRFFADLRARDLASRRTLLGVGPRRAEILIAGTAVFLHVLEAFQHPSLYYSAAGVRDGIIADLASRGVGRELSLLTREQRRVVEQKARRYGVQIKHARQVARLAGQLFEGLRQAHGLQPEMGKLLEAAAYLHDVGHFISGIGHHRHSYYLVEHSDMPGFTDEERQRIALLCRYHRKGLPNAKHAGFQALPLEDRRAIQMLIPLLRIADSLDRSHEQRVQDVTTSSRAGGVIIDLASNVETDLEVWAAEKNGDSFRQIYQMPVTFTRSRARESA